MGESIDYIEESVMLGGGSVGLWGLWVNDIGFVVMDIEEWIPPRNGVYDGRIDVSSER